MKPPLFFFFFGFLLTKTVPPSLTSHSWHSVPPCVLSIRPSRAFSVSSLTSFTSLLRARTSSFVFFPFTASLLTFSLLVPVGSYKVAVSTSDIRLIIAEIQVVSIQGRTLLKETLEVRKGEEGTLSSLPYSLLCKFPSFSLFFFFLLSLTSNFPTFCLARSLLSSLVTLPQLSASKLKEKILQQRL